MRRGFAHGPVVLVLHSPFSHTHPWFPILLPPSLPPPNPPQECSIEDIKRAYKKKSLELHPDKLAQRGQVLTPEDQARFQRVKEAYEVLVDPKRRDLYDEFGETGLKLIEDPQSMDPQTAFVNFMRSSSYDRCAIFMTIVGVTAFVLMWPVLLCLQVRVRYFYLGKLDLRVVLLLFYVSIYVYLRVLYVIFCVDSHACVSLCVLGNMCSHDQNRSSSTIQTLILPPSFPPFLLPLRPTRTSTFPGRPSGPLCGCSTP